MLCSPGVPSSAGIHMVVIVMGVAGSGKTTVGRLLADELAWAFYDADHLHPEANVAKMSAGRPLDDEDREPWLGEVEALVRRLVEEGAPAVLACSALKQSYREQLTVSDEVRWVYLTGERELLARRLAERTGHFMSAELLESQFRDLEEPGAEVARFDVAPTAPEIVAAVRAELRV